MQTQKLIVSALSVMMLLTTAPLNVAAEDEVNTTENQAQENIQEQQYETNEVDGEADSTSTQEDGSEDDSDVSVTQEESQTEESVSEEPSQETEEPVQESSTPLKEPVEETTEDGVIETDAVKAVRELYEAIISDYFYEASDENSISNILLNMDEETLSACGERLDVAGSAFDALSEEEQAFFEENNEELLNQISEIMSATSPLSEESAPVAQVDTTTYTDISEAISAWVTSGGTLTLLDDATYDMTSLTKGAGVTITTTAVLDLNGHTLTTKSHGDTIKGAVTVAFISVGANGNLTIRDSQSGGKLTSDGAFTFNRLKHVVDTITVTDPSAVLNVESGTVTASDVEKSSNAAIYVTAGTVNVTGGTITNAGAYGLYAYGTKAKVVATGGTIETTKASSIALYICYGTAELSDNVTVSGTSYAINTSVATVSISGGTYTASTTSAINVTYKTKVTITGGTFTAPEGKPTIINGGSGASGATTLVIGSQDGSASDLNIASIGMNGENQNTSILSGAIGTVGYWSYSKWNSDILTYKLAAVGTNVAFGDASVKEHLPEGYSLQANSDGSYSPHKADETAIAMVNGKDCTSWDEVVSAIGSATGSIRVDLIKDIDVTSALSISESQDVTMIGEHTLTLTSGDGIVSVNGGTLTIKNATLAAGSVAKPAITITGGTVNLTGSTKVTGSTSDDKVEAVHVTDGTILMQDTASVTSDYKGILLGEENAANVAPTLVIGGTANGNTPVVKGGTSNGTDQYGVRFLPGISVIKQNSGSLNKAVSIQIDVLTDDNTSFPLNIMSKEGTNKFISVSSYLSKNVSVWNSGVQLDDVSINQVKATQVEGSSTYVAYIQAQQKELIARIYDKDGNFKQNVAADSDLDTAFANLEDGQTIKFLKDGEFNQIKWQNQSITLDLNGHTLTNSVSTTNAIELSTFNSEARPSVTIKNGTINCTSFNGAYSAIKVTGGVDLTIENATITAGGTGSYGINIVNSGSKDTNVTVKGTSNISGATAGIVVWGNNDKYEGKAVLDVQDGTVSGGTYGISGNGSADGTSITISGGTVECTGTDGATIYHPQDNGTLTITGGTFTGPVGIQMCSGTLTISDDPTVTATGSNTKASKTGDGVIPDGAAVSIVNRDGYGDAPIVKISGGTFKSNTKAVDYYKSTGSNPIEYSEWDATTDNIALSGGLYSSNPENEIITSGKDGYEETVQGVTMYRVRRPQYTIVVNGIRKDTKTVDKGTAISNFTSYVEDGYDFIGIYTDSAMTTPFENQSSVTISEDTDIYVKALYRPTYKVYVNGSLKDTKTVAYGTSISNFTSYVEDGYDFIGIYTDSAMTIPFENQSSVTISEDTDIHVKKVQKTADVVTEKKAAGTIASVDESVARASGLDGTTIAQQASSSSLTSTVDSNVSTLTNDILVDEVNNTKDGKETLEITTETVTSDQLKVIEKHGIEVELKEVTKEENKAVLTYDVDAICNLWITKITNNADANDSNSILYGAYKLAKVTVPEGGIQMTLPVGTVFDELNVSADNIYVIHTHNGVDYVYPVAYDSANKTVTFCNTHGFSTFRVVADQRNGAIELQGKTTITGVNLSKLNQELPMMVDESNKKFVGWSYNGKIYTTISEELIDLTGNTTITLTPFYETVSTSTTTTSSWDDGGPFTTDSCGNVYDRWGNKIYTAKSCAIKGYSLVNTGVK